jgi:cellulose synthase/poly-beta-1,6-N-acetylglucosamine synthase-like glycosyltransferase
LLVVALIALGVQLAAWALIAVGLARVRARQPRGDSAVTVPVSVVVAAHNEASRLPALLDALEAQTHRPFEVVIVDDRSVDGTAEVVAAHGMPALRLVRIDAEEAQPFDSPPKKRAIARGIDDTRYDRVAVTDADCRPGPAWLATLARHAAPQGADDGALLIGYGPYRKGAGALTTFVRYETMMTAILTAAATGLDRPYMAVGRNLSYPGDLLRRLGGFETAAPGLSGDDDLLVQSAARGGTPARFVLDPASFVMTEPPATMREWIRQKRRHASAGRRYVAGALAALGMLHASSLAIWLAPVFLGWTGAALLAIRILVQRQVLRRALVEFDARDLSFAQPLLDAGYAVYNVGFTVLGALPDPRRW